MLHTLSVGAGHLQYQGCLRMLRTDDAVLLMNRGVYLAMTGCSECAQLLHSGAAVYVLEADARAAGVIDRLAPEVTVCDYKGFVELTTEHSRFCAWY